MFFDRERFLLTTQKDAVDCSADGGCFVHQPPRKNRNLLTAISEPLDVSMTKEKEDY